MKFQKKQENIVGTRQGIYDVLYECNFKSNDGHRMFHVKCSECGWETDMQMHKIKHVTICRHVGLGGNYLISYPWKNKRIGRIFRGMKKRCYNPKEKSYKWYGAKSIKIYNEWLNEPLSFENWALSHGYRDDLTIDRIDSNKDYYPENCRWIAMEENTQRAGAVNWLEVNGQLLTGREWAVKLGLGLQTINYYLRRFPVDKVKELIIAILNNPLPIQNHERKSHQTWFDIYNIKV